MPSLPLTRRQALLAALAVALCLLLAGRFLVRLGAPGDERPPAPRPVRSLAARTPGLVVDVSGAVRRPGLYRLRPGARVADALARAGGATARADVEAVNLAAPLADGQKVLVPRTHPASAGPASPAAGAGGPAGRVSLSTATLEELDALPGVGPVTAQRILDYRQKQGGFRSVEELDAVPGIGPARLEQLRELVVP